MARSTKPRGVQLSTQGHSAQGGHAEASPANVTPSSLTIGSLKVFKTFETGAIANVKIVAIGGNLKDPLFVAKMYKIGAGFGNSDEEKNIRTKFEREYDVLHRSVHPNIVKLHTPTSDCEKLDITRLSSRGVLGSSRQQSSSSESHSSVAEGQSAASTSANRRVTRANRIICLELMDLGSLKDVLMKARPHVQQPEHLHEFAKAIAVPCLLGLQYLHAQGTKHRDVKPENILLSKEGRVKWCDFDCCIESVAQTINIGTNGYIAPELFLSNGAAYTEKVDLWSLGCVLYWMVTNETPQTSLTIAILTAKLSADKDWQFREIFDLDTTIVDADLRDLLFHLLETNPAKRYNSFEALRHPALSKYYRGPGVIPRDNEHSKAMAPFRRCNFEMDAESCTEESELDIIAKVSKKECDNVSLEDRNAMRTSFKMLTYSRQKPAMDRICKFLRDHKLPCLVEPAALAAWKEENTAIAKAASAAAAVSNSDNTAAPAEQLQPSSPPLASEQGSFSRHSTNDETCGS